MVPYFPRFMEIFQGYVHEEQSEEIICLQIQAVGEYIQGDLKSCTSH
jgi:hypothetical protein